MDLALVSSAFVLGLAGAPHCTAMCAVPCTAAIGRTGNAGALAFHASRIAGYALAGALAAGMMGLLAGAAAAAPALRALWTLLHAAAFALGLWMLIRGRAPSFAIVAPPLPPALAAQGWQRLRAPLRAGAFGGIWVAWPCGLLQSALVVAALANSPTGGAAVMAAFALASSAGLVFAPWLWGRLGRGGSKRAEQLAARGAGLLVAALSGWALGHGLWQPVLDYCKTRFW
jgi:sulfite exporter TauE/SafE